jgi:hypothetical protein
MAIAEAIDEILMIGPTEPCFIALGSIEFPPGRCTTVAKPMVDECTQCLCLDRKPRVAPR